MSSRRIVASLSILLFCKQFISINQLTFDYHNNPTPQEQLVDYKKGTYLISFKYFQHVLNKYQNPKIGDLVLAEQPDKTLKFKIVQAIPQTYYTQIQNNMYYYVPNGYVVLKDPETNANKMQFIANVRGCDHYPLKF